MGHPVTSGHAIVDFFFSSELMEPEDGDGALYRAPDTAAGTRHPICPFAGRHQPDALRPRSAGDAHLYFFPHALFKVHPENDATVARILAQDPAGLLVLCAGENRWMTRAFLDRLAAALERNGVGSIG